MAFGLKPVAHRNGAPYNGNATRYCIPATDATNYFIGDPVRLAGTTDAAGVTPTVKIAVVTTDTVVLGPIVAFDYTPTNLAVQYGAASTLRYCWVADDPDLVFEVQEDAVGSALVAGDIGDRFKLAAGAGGSTVSGMSSWVLDSSTTNEATDQYTVIGLKNVAGNAFATAGGTGATFRVVIENDQHQFGSLATPVSTPA